MIDVVIIIFILAVVNALYLVKLDIEALDEQRNRDENLSREVRRNVNR